VESLEFHREARDQAVAGVRRGQVIFGLLGLAIAGMLGLRYLQGKPVLSPRSTELLAFVTGQSGGGPPLPAAPPPESPAAQAGGAGAEQGPAAMVDPKGALAPFFQRLEALEAGIAKRPVRVLFYGTSEIGFDRVTSQIRRTLQKRFGDGGKGFVVISRGWRYQRHRDILWTVPPDRWQVFSVLGRRRPDGRYGLGGVLAINRATGSQVTYETVPLSQAMPEGYFPFPSGTRFSKAVLYYQEFPEGGSVRWEVDGRLAKTVATVGPEVADRTALISLQDGPHRVRLTARDGEVRLYGISFERPRGFVLDAVMAVGGGGDTQLGYDPEHLKGQVAARHPDLIVFQFGANEAARRGGLSEQEIERFVLDYEEGVRRTLAGQPDAACLIISSKDLGVRRRNVIETAPGVLPIVRGSAEVARRTGCAFLNLFERMGGEGTMRRFWLHEPRLVSSDLGHLMRQGAVQVGDSIASALLEDYAQFAHRSRPDAGNG
jgi:hypothetical protein